MPSMLCATLRAIPKTVGTGQQAARGHRAAPPCRTGIRGGTAIRSRPARVDAPQKLGAAPPLVSPGLAPPASGRGRSAGPGNCSSRSNRHAETINTRKRMGAALPPSIPASRPPPTRVCRRIKRSGHSASPMSRQRNLRRRLRAKSHQRSPRYPNRAQSQEGRRLTRSARRPNRGRTRAAKASGAPLPDRLAFCTISKIRFSFIWGAPSLRGRGPEARDLHSPPAP